MEVVVSEVVEKTEDQIAAQNNEQKQISIKLLNNNNVSEELLGSVTTCLTDGPAVRTSARVIHKLRMDSTPLPQSEKKETQNETATVALPKTPSQSKPPHVRVQWVNVEKNFFFDALNEHGRDFDQISRFINAKMKRKSPSDQDYKTKDHIRQLYYQIYTKASKYLRFSDDVKKVPQELYTLINYGEMKRKLVMSSEKRFLKLRELVYKGSVSIRFKGKNIKVKTPSCRALRKLNQLEGNTLEDVQLPQRVDVILRPVNMQSWGYIQSLAQNPRIRMVSLPLQKRLASLLHTMQQKWQTNNVRLYEKYVINGIQKHGVQKIGEDIVTQSQADTTQLKSEEPVLRFMPPRDTVIHRPMIQLNELLSSYNLCLNSYEERIGAQTRGETLCSEKFTHIKDLLKHSSKRIRNDSASEKIAKAAKVEEAKEVSKEANISVKITEEAGISVIEHGDSFEADLMKPEMNDNESFKSENVEDVVMTPLEKIEEVDVNSFVDTKSFMHADIKPMTNVEPKVTVHVESKPSVPPTSTHKSKKKDSSAMVTKQMNKDNPFKPLIDEEMLKKIRKGWTLANVGDLTIGDMYLMFGSDSRLVLEYDCEFYPEVSPKTNVEVVESKIAEKSLGGKLKSLLAVANLMEGTNSPLLSNFFAGHGCERNGGEANGTDGTFKQPIGPRIDLFNRSMNPRNKVLQSRWLHDRMKLSQRPMSCQIIGGASGNHVVRDLYQTPSAEKTVESQQNKKQQSDKNDEVERIIEDKIQNISGTMKVNNFLESSRSSISSLLDYLTPSDIPKSMSIGDESSFSLKLLEENVKNSNDDIDNYSLSSFLCRLDQDEDNNDQGI